MKVVQRHEWTFDKEAPATLADLEVLVNEAKAAGISPDAVLRVRTGKLSMNQNGISVVRIRLVTEK